MAKKVAKKFDSRSEGFISSLVRQILGELPTSVYGKWDGGEYEASLDHIQVESGEDIIEIDGISWINEEGDGEEPITQAYTITITLTPVKITRNIQIEEIE